MLEGSKEVAVSQGPVTDPREDPREKKTSAPPVARWNTGEKTLLVRRARMQDVTDHSRRSAKNVLEQMVSQAQMKKKEEEEAKKKVAGLVHRKDD